MAVFYSLFYYLDENEKEIQNWEKYTVRFEDIKCQPHKELNNICIKMGVPWSDILLETTSRGQAGLPHLGITGFDLRPVYNLYEEYFSGMDRFRLSLLAAEWQKKHGYPYESILNFTRRELQEIFLKKFRFQKLLQFYNEEEEMECRLAVQKRIAYLLLKARKDEVMKEKGDI